MYLYCVPKSDAKIQIIIAATELIRINYPINLINQNLEYI